MLRNVIHIVDCPTCGKPVEWSDKQPYRPFCGERCRLIDPGGWVDGSHCIADDEQPPEH